MIGRSRLKLFFFALVVSAGACKEPVPEFVREMVDSHLQHDIRAIWRYRFNGETVYYVQSSCCDLYNDLYTAHGKNICSPDGGITGGGDGRCPTFWKDAKHRVVIWEKGQEIPPDLR